MNECVLAVLPAANEGERLLVVLVQDSAAGTRIALRQQSWGEGLGWFTQKTMDLEASQAAMLRGVLGAKSNAKQLPAVAMPALSASEDRPTLQLWRVESA